MSKFLKMGSFFLVKVLALLVLASHLVAQSSIELPLTPPAAPIPTLDEASRAERQQERKKALQELGVEKEEKKETFSDKQKEKLVEENLKPVDYSFLINAHLSYGLLTVSGDGRSDYNLDPVTGLGVLAKMWKPSTDSNLSMWAGLRSAFFSGSGKQGDQTGHFSFSYFGPSIMVGRIDPVQAFLGQDAKDEKKRHEQALQPRNAFFFELGIAACSSAGQVDSNSDNSGTEDDFKTRAIGLDAPGIWFETHYARIFYNAISYGAVAGMQMGKGKNFFFFGIEVAGWN